MSELDYQSRIVFSGQQIKIGAFRCPAGSSLWSTENVAGHLPMLVFPRTSVGIRQAKRDMVIASANQVMFYNAHQTYWRERVANQADICEYFYINPSSIEEAFRSIGARTPQDLMSPFSFSNAPCPPRPYFVQRILYKVSKKSEDNDPVFIEETFLNALPGLLRIAMKHNNPFETRRPPAAKGNHRETCEAAKEYIGENFQDVIQLKNVADFVGCSVFHLCRIFRKQTGSSLYKYIFQMRIRNTLAEVVETNCPLTEVALRNGFSSHSHFTNSFRDVFGLSPSAIRRGDIHDFHRIISS